MVLKTHSGQGQRAHKIKHHHEVAQVFLVYQGMNEESQNTDHPVLEQSNREQVGEIETKLEVAIAVHELHDDPGCHGDQDENDLHQQ